MHVELEKFLVAYLEINCSDLHSKEMQSSDTKLSEEITNVNSTEQCKFTES